MWGKEVGGRCVWCHHFMKLLVIRIPLTYRYSEFAENEQPGTTHILSHVCMVLTSAIFLK